MNEVTALIMAGGRGTRMKLREEKCLLKICGKPMIERVLDAVINSKNVDKIIVAVSKYTPKTAEFLKKYPLVSIIETTGEGYVEDLRYVVKKLDLGIVLTLSADLPLLTSDVIDEVLEYYRKSNKPALKVLVPVSLKRRIGMSEDTKQGNELAPAGINIIDGKRLDKGYLEEEELILDKVEVAVNVNTMHDLEVAIHLLSCKRI